MKLFRAALIVGALVVPAAANAQNPAGGYGRALAISGGDVLVSQANNQINPGAVFIYRKVANKWTEQAKLVSSQASPNDGFGTGIALSGDLMLISAPRANNNRGAVFVFQRDGKGAWHEVAQLTAPDTATNTGFGAPVAFVNDLAVVGAPTANRQTGTAHVFRRSGNRWTHEASLVSPEPKEQMFFGQGIGIAKGQILVVETGYEERTGRVLVFKREGNEWKTTTRLTPNGLQKNDRYGAPIRVEGDRVLVSAAGFASNVGAVFTFVPDPQFDWKEGGRLLPYDGRAGDQFGSAIAVDGNHVWIGTPRANNFRGVVYHIARNPADTTASTAERIHAGDLGGQSFFGAVVAAQGNVAAASALNADFGLGAVAIFENAGGKWNLSTVLHAADERIASIAGKKVECNNGKAGQFECSDVELMSYLSVPDIGGGRGVQLNDIWGWTDPQTGKEWALVGRMDGTSFVDVSNPEKPVYVGNLPLTKGAIPNTWRDIKVYKDHAFIVADGAGAHGMQVFDLTRLRNVKQPPVTFEPDFTYRGINSSHNIVINEATGFAYAVGASGGGETCGGGLHMVNIQSPKKPEFAGCFADPQTGRANTGYSHDAQCVTYNGPDAQYKGREICIGSNETMISVADVTDKKNPKAIARASYPNVGYSHQGWFDEEHRYFYMDDELDELQGSTPKTRTIVWDLTDLDDPQVATMYLSPTAASDHNLYIKGDTMYQSHYQAGVRLVDIKNRTAPVEIGYFDTVPYGENKPGFGGSWSNYPYFKSGNIIATSMSEGLFVLRKKAPSKPVL